MFFFERWEWRRTRNSRIPDIGLAVGQMGRSLVMLGFCVWKKLGLGVVFGWPDWPRKTF